MTREKATVTTGFNLERFTISQHENRYYCVSVPNYEGGAVVRAEVYDALLSEVAQLRAALEKSAQAVSLSQEKG